MSIGVYDSGIGGLTVYRSLAAKFPHLDMIYLGDSARVPYGNKSPSAIIKYSLECAAYLASLYELSAFVVACNTVSSHALDALHDMLKIPVLGVIKPGATHAINITSNNKIGVLGTHATVDSGSYIKEIKNQSKNNITVYQQACPLFVPLVEEALVDGDMVETVVRESLKDILKKDIDTAILACTHYPVLAPVIQKVFGNRVKIVDSTEYIINDINSLNINLNEAGVRQIYITDESHAFHSLKNMLVGNVPVEVVNIFQQH